MRRTCAAAAAAAALLTLALACGRAAAAPGDVRAALYGQKLNSAAAMLDAIGLQEEQIPKSMDIIILAPTNAAIAEFAKSMGLTQAQLLARPALVDSLVAYHMVPRARLGQGGRDLAGLKAGGAAVAARTVDPSWALRFSLDAAGKQLTVKDAQGNVARVVAGPIPVSGGGKASSTSSSSSSSSSSSPRVELFVVDRVLLNGEVFLTPRAFLERHPKRFSSIAQLAEKADPALAKAMAGAGGPAAVPDRTFFLPNNAAFAAANATLGRLSPAEARRVLEYHQVQGSRAIPYGFPAGGQPVPTLLPGNSLSVKLTTSKPIFEAATNRSVKFTSAEVVPDSGAASARVVFSNIFAGRATLQGIDRVLLPKAAAPAAAAAAPKPAGHRRRLLRGGFGGGGGRGFGGGSGFRGSYGGGFGRDASAWRAPAYGGFHDSNTAWGLAGAAATGAAVGATAGRGWGDGLAPYPVAVPYGVGVPVAEPDYADYEGEDCVNCPYPPPPQG